VTFTAARALPRCAVIAVNFHNQQVFIFWSVLRYLNISFSADQPWH